MFRPLTMLAAATLAVFGFAGPSHATDATTPATAASVNLPDIPFTRFTLPNGLTVVVSEDHKAPIVAVAVWYHVGSAREPMGKSGYAHLFEHLMFERSGHHDGNYFQPFEKVGAIGMNGTTARDRTNYFETVPTTALDMALWMESDRMGWLLEGLDKGSVDQQRGVVQNEKRQDENQPYGLRVQENIEAHTYPLNHPYHHDTIGSMKDLNAASIEDFKHWFETYYGPNNATLVMVGDITPAQAKAKALKYFGNIPASAPVAPLPAWTFPRTTSTRGTLHMDVPQVRIYREWNTPHSGTKADNLLSLAASVLGGDKTSRLYQRLVYQDKLADSVSVSDSSGELASQFELEVHVKHGADLKKVEAAIADVWQQFLKDGPTEDELNRAKTGFRAYMVRRLERVGGFGGKATLLAAGQVYHNDPGHWRKDLATMMAATPDDVRDSARKWLSQGDYTLTVLPLAKDASVKADDATKSKSAQDGHAKSNDAAEVTGLGPSKDKPAPVAPVKQDWRTVKSDVDRSKGVPQVTKFPELDFPTMQHATLDNGIKVTLAERHSVPLVEMRLQFNAGYAADQGHKLGTAAFTMAMLDEGTKDLDSVEIAKRKQRLGAFIRSGCGLDTCSVTLNALSDKLTPSLDLLADIVRHPAFREDDVTRIRGQWLAGIKQEKARPMTLALRVAPPLLYGKDHAYGIPFTGTGSASSIKSLTTADMRRFMHDFIRPDNVTILVTGDTKLDPLLKRLNDVFGQWKAPDSAVPKKNIAHVDKPGKVRVYLMDRPGSLQSVILAGMVSPSTEAPNHLDIQTMNGVFGGTFTSRLNMNLREDKHWAYGAHSFISSSVGQSPFLMYAAVQTDKTAPSISEILKESKAIIGPKPPTDAEIEKIKQRDVRALPGQYQTNAAVLSAMASNVLYDRPDDYVQTLKAHINGLKDKNIVAAAKQVIQPEHLTWVIVGDLKKIEKPVRALKLGSVKVLDDNGNVVR